MVADSYNIYVNYYELISKGGEVTGKLEINFYENQVIHFATFNLFSLASTIYIVIYIYIFNMSISNMANHLQKTLYEFVNFNNFTADGKNIFKEIEKTIINYNRHPESIFAWLHILESSEIASVLFLASLLLKDKLKYDFDQYDQSSIEKVHEALVTLMKNKFKQPQKIVFNNLSLCLVYIYMHCSKEIGNVLTYLENLFKPENQIYLLKVLELLPEEINDSKIVIDIKIRKQTKSLLTDSQTKVLIKTHQLSSNLQQDSPLVPILLNLFANWIELTHNSVVEKELHNHNMLKNIFHFLSNPKLNEMAASSLATVISMMKSLEENEKLFIYIGENIFKILHEIDSAMKMDEIELSYTYAKVLCDFGTNAASSLIKKYDDNTAKYLLKMIELVESEDAEIFYKTADFWESFLQALKRKKENSPFKDEKELILKLCYSLFKKIQYSWTHFNDLNQISQNSLTKLTKSVQETYDMREMSRYLFEGMGEILGKQQFVAEMLKIIKQIQNNPQEIYNQILDVILFSLQDVVKEYPNHSNQICELILFYEKLDSPYILIRKDFLKIFEGLFTIKTKNIEFIMRLFHNISIMLSHQLLIEKAAKAFAFGCKQNSNLIFKNLSQFLTLLESYPNERYILEGVLSILITHESQIQSCLPKIVNYPLKIINTTEKQFTEKKKAYGSIFTVIEVLLSKDSNVIDEALLCLMGEIWPTVKKTIEKPKSVEKGEKLIEKGIKLIKKIMRRIPRKFLPYLKQLMETVVCSYKLYPIASFLYTFEITITAYAEFEENVVKYLIEIYKQLSDLTFLYLNSSTQQFVDYQYLIYDFLGMNYRILIFNSSVLFLSGKLSEIIKLSLNCLQFDIPSLLSSACQVFESIFMVYWNPYSIEKYKNTEKGEIVNFKYQNVPIYNEIKAYLQPYIPEMLIKLLTVLKTSPSSLGRNTTIDCMIAAILAYPEKTHFHWEKAITSIEDDILTKSQKEQFREALTHINTDNNPEFLTAEYKITKSMETIANRYSSKKIRNNAGIKIH